MNIIYSYPSYGSIFNAAFTVDGVQGTTITATFTVNACQILFELIPTPTVVTKMKALHITPSQVQPVIDFQLNTPEVSFELKTIISI